MRRLCAGSLGGCRGSHVRGGELGECLIMVSNTATCLGITFLYWGMCKVTPHLGVVQ